MTGVGRAIAVTVSVAALNASSPSLADELEYPVKVEFIERFTRFIAWPPEAFRGADGPFVLCVLGETPAQPYLTKLARERSLKDRRVEERRVKAGDELGGCNLLFIGGSERPRVKQEVQSVMGRPVLTVADSEGFAREGVLINLFLDEDGHVRFEISSGGLRRSGLKVNAQLLRLARVVPE
jgi:hypothetical protein